ncbi:ABC transporter substrate-binding protein [Aurantibacillus circumpalustris]|uniref:ABC transporter substrate-binding protein n=1 Tax=Aurantibacillus circumpalustris TaxID=3036359 RepID=UPI00295BEA29|nr:helical backbone metal receptor [Aurantibacillus circumpalustris]
MLNYKDQLGNVIQLAKKPLRIISVVPSQSEFLWDIGLRDELVGITKFCIHPKEMRVSKARVGGTKKLNLKKIRELKPDLIIGNKEENDQFQIEELQKEFPVWMSDIYTFQDAFKMMEGLGILLNKEPETMQVVNELKMSFLRIQAILKTQKVAYFIWNKPYMFAAKNTFIDHVLNYLGLENALSYYERYPELDETALKRINPDLCFLSSEPFRFKEIHVDELKKLLPNSKILIVDGEMFSWYGTRLLFLEKYVQDLINSLREAKR